MRLNNNTDNIYANAPVLLGACSSDMYPLHFIQSVQNALSNTNNNSLQPSIILCSLDNLSMIISGFGHDCTEKLIASIQQEITDMQNSKDICIRLQKQQIAILSISEDNKSLNIFIDRIRHILNHCGYNSSHDALHLMYSIACITATSACTQAEDLINHAFITLAEMESHNRISIKDYEASTVSSAKARQEMGLANYLQRAMKENRLRLAYQPVIRSKDGNVVHYEALLRIISDDGNINSAGPLIPVAERMGIIQDIDDFVMRRVIEEVENAPDVHLAFNVSNVTTENRQWLTAFQQLLAGKPEVASRIMVEITETAMHLDLKNTAYFVAAIQATGAQVALDDFGSGYTSFRQLKTLSVDVVKIDGAFVKDLAENADNRLFVKTLMEFIHGFGLTAVAEYVETGEIAKILMEMGVDYMQGYYFGKPSNTRSWRVD